MRSRRLKCLIMLILAGNFSLSVSAARGDEKYYVMIFAAEGSPNTPRLAHTFAVFVKVPERKQGGPKRQRIEAHTISWLPATLDVRLLLQPPEQGVNLDLDATLKHEAGINAAVSAWGPFQIQKGLYDRALVQTERLKSGGAAYKAVDRRFRPTVATNCFHAVSDIVERPLLDTGAAFGVPASLMVMQHLAPWFVEPQTIHRDVLKSLNLDGYSISYRDEVPAVIATKGSR